MPTSPRNLTGGTGLYKRTAQSSNPRGDVGIAPYANGKPLPLIRQGLRPATFPGGEGDLRRGLL